MNEYINKDFKKALSSLVLNEGTSKEGSKYLYLELEFTNGYKKRVFINSEAEFAVRNAYDTLEKAEKSRRDFRSEFEDDID